MVGDLKDAHLLEKVEGEISEHFKADPVGCKLQEGCMSAMG